MPICTLSDVLEPARRERYAVGAFNVENMEMAQAVVEAAEALRSPVILQTTPSTLKHAAPELMAAMVGSLARRAAVPVVFHLDHGSSFQLAARAFRAGYSSVMIDGSKLPLEENIALTASVVRMCAASGIAVEGEIGSIGGKEDDLVGNNIYTDPGQAKRFAEETGIQAMAIAVGTAHGVYKKEPRVDLDRIEAIRTLTDVPLVLHGTSGVPDETVRACIARGICKVNYATDLRIAFTRGIRETLEADPAVYDPKTYTAVGKQYVRRYVEDRIRNCGSAGKA